ncbi:hypothetical protein KAU34_03215, partial [candidate division WOR-3 bacterium]|nr:hypothetical protein [candidate division WOR-3 bacterium]
MKCLLQSFVVMICVVSITMATAKSTSHAGNVNTIPNVLVRYGDKRGDQPVVASRQDSLNVRRVGSWYNGLLWYAHEVTASGNYCYLGWGSGVSIIDISDPYNPYDVGRIWTTSPYAPYDICVVDTIVYIADIAHLLIVSVSDPTQPQQLGTYTFAGDENATSVVVSDTVVYVATQNWNSPRGLRILNVSDPANITELAFLPTPYSTGRVCIRDNYVYLVDYAVILRIIDVSDPSAPVELGQVDLAGFFPEEVCVNGNYAFVAAEDGGTQIANIENSSNPFYVTFIWPSVDMTYGVHVVDSFAYIADYTGGLRVVDVSDPSAPVEKGYYVTPSKTTKAYFLNGYIYTAILESALMVFEYYSGTGVEEHASGYSPRQIEIHPNPFSEKVEIRFQMTEVRGQNPENRNNESDISLLIFDVTGRKVREISLLP